MSHIKRDAWDNVVVVTRDGTTDSTWDGKVKNLVYDVGTMAWISQTQAVGGGGDATASNQTVGNASLASIDTKITAVNTGAVVVSSSALPTGAATSAKQPALGTAGTPSADVITVQGAVSMTALKVDGSAVTQPVSGTVTATGPLTDGQLRATAVPVSGTVTSNVGTTNGLALDATLTGGTTKAIARGGAKGATAAGDVTSTAVDANTQALDVSVKGTATVSGTVTANAGTGTMAVSGPLTDAQLRAATVPVSGTVTANAGTGTMAVSAASLPLPTGASTEATLVKLPLAQGSTTASQSGALVQGAVTTAAPTYTTAQTSPLSLNTAGGLRVDGSGVTQPVSGTITANIGTSGSLALDATLTGGTQRTKITDGTTNAAVKAASTAAVAADPALVVAISPNNTVGVNNAQINGVTPLMGNGVTGTGSQRVTIASDNTAFPVNATLTAETTKVIGTVNAPAITKATQGASGFTTQDLKDAGRNQTNFFMSVQIVSTATDALMSLTGYKSGAAVVATTTPAVVTTGKTYRINSVTLDYTTIVTTPGAVRFTLRANTAGVVAIGSPSVTTWEVGEPTGIAPVAGKKNTVHLAFPDGIEFAAGTGIGISMVGLNTVGTAAVVGYGKASIHGYEY